MLHNKYYYVDKRNKVDPNPLSIYWATDAHVNALVDGNASATNAIGGTRYFYTAGQKMQNFVDAVNVGSPHLVYFSGDMLEQWGYAGSADLFMSKWNQINPSIKKELTIGNHDIAGVSSFSVVNNEMATKFGYGGKPIIAGSKYNQSFYLDNGYNKVKIISIDTNIDANGIHTVTTPQLMKQPVRDWVESEILNSTVSTVILFSHGGAADDYSHFNPDDSAAFKTMIDRVVLQKPELKLYSLFGHNHRQGITEYKTLGDNIKCFSISPVVDYLTGSYAVVKVGNAGIQTIEYPLRYPYP